MTEYGSVTSTKKGWTVLRLVAGARPNPLPAKQNVLTFHSAAAAGAVTEIFLLPLELGGRENLHEEIHLLVEREGDAMRGAHGPAEGGDTGPHAWIKLCCIANDFCSSGSPQGISQQPFP